MAEPTILELLQAIEEAQLAETVASVVDELSRQRAKWGQQDHGLYEWIAILGEESGEAAQAAIEHERGNEPSPADTYREFIQCAAVAISAAAALRRRECVAVPWCGDGGANG